MTRFFKRFLCDNDGAVTVDWIVLTAGIVGFCIMAFTVMQNSTVELRDGLASAIEAEANAFSE